MTKDRISESIGNISDRFIDEAITDQSNVIPSNSGKVIAMKNTKYRKNHGRHMFKIILVACFIIALSTAAFAAVFSHLAERKTEIATIETSRQDPSVQATGILGSPEYLAAKEWNTCVDELYASGRNNFASDTPIDTYTWAGANSQEAREALDAILVKYSLKMPSHQKAISAGDISGLVGDAAVFPVEVEGPGTYLEGGSLEFVTGTTLSTGKYISYDAYRYVTGWFSRGIRIFTDPDNMEEWIYTTASGTMVTLDLGENQSVLMAELGNSFVYIHIRSGSANSDPDRSSYGKATVTREDLEAFAEMIDFIRLDSLR